MPFAVFDADKVKLEGELKSWRSSPDYDRKFCPVCGSRVIGVNGGEVEISLGSLDEENQLTPEYESWVRHRENWLTPLRAPQFAENRCTDAKSGD